VSPLFGKRGDDDRERTPEERAQARAEREARRRKRRGEPAPDLFDVESAPPTPPPVEEVPPPVVEEPPPPVVEAPPPAPEPEPEPIAPPEPEPVAQQPERLAADDPLVPPPTAQRPTPTALPADPQPTTEIPAHELPDGGVSLEEEPPPPAEAPTPPPPLPRSPDTARRGGGEGPGGGRKWLLRILAVLALALAAAGIWFAVSLFQPFKGSASTTRVTLVVPKGADAGKIGDLLERRGVVSSSFFFGLRARLAGKRTDLKPGVYRLRQDSSYGDVLDVLSKGPPRLKKVAITIPEGRSRAEEAQKIRANSSLQGSYLAASKRSPVLNPRRFGAPGGTPSLEGFLFPSTYEVRPAAPVKALVTEQLKAFKRAIRRVPMRAARRKNLTTYDVLTIASMVEREAMLRRERPIIAGVIYNRLKDNIPLGIDATIRYATGNWLRPLTQSQLKINSGYNTRTHQGLPPTPIGSPGLASIRAAAHPKRTKYLYYVVKPGGCGEHVFTRTFAQFEKASARYNSARAKRGGRSPTKCK
jgi:UPF0755 protein